MIEKSLLVRDIFYLFKKAKERINDNNSKINQITTTEIFKSRLNKGKYFLHFVARHGKNIP